MKNIKKKSKTANKHSKKKSLDCKTKPMPTNPLPITFIAKYPQNNQKKGKISKTTSKPYFSWTINFYLNNVNWIQWNRCFKAIWKTVRKWSEEKSKKSNCWRQSSLNSKLNLTIPLIPTITSWSRKTEGSLSTPVKWFIKSKKKNNHRKINL